MTYGRVSEREVVHRYMDALFEYLDEDRVRCQIFTESEPILDNSLIVHCHIGWNKAGSKAKCNISTVSHISNEALPLSNMLCESLSEWGKSYVDFHHKTGSPRDGDECVSNKTQNTCAVVLRPFKLNGPQSEEYVQRLDELGKSIAHCIYEFLVSRNEQPKNSAN